MVKWEYYTILAADMGEENPGLSEEELVKIRDEKYPLPAEVEFRMHE